jgi:hypothetical protein
MTARARFTQADVKRVLAGAAAAGQSVRVIITPAGQIEILPVTGKPTHDNDEWADLE